MGKSFTWIEALEFFFRRFKTLELCLVCFSPRIHKQAGDVIADGEVIHFVSAVTHLETHYTGRMNGPMEG